MTGRPSPEQTIREAEAAIRSRAELATTRDDGAYSEARELGRDVLALLSENTRLVAELAAMTSGRDWQYEKAVEWRNRAVVSEAERDAAVRVADTYKQALTNVQRTPCEFGYEATPERLNCCCGACQNERIATAALSDVSGDNHEEAMRATGQRPPTGPNESGVSGDEATKRVRMDLSDGAYMDVNVSPDVEAETLEALRSVGEAVVKRVNEKPRLEACDCGSAQANHGWACRCESPPSSRASGDEEATP